MKRFINRLVVVSFLSLALTAGITGKTHAQNVNVSFQTFYDNLSPYGQWIYDPEFGDVWVPNEDSDFRPYGSRGHWLMTEYGNTWISEDPWGWAVYHYGRWTYNPYYGWVWIPGYEWAPAWVTWRFGGGYSGWAPLGPNIGVGISWAPPISWWVFVNPQYMYQPNLIRYWRGPSYNNTYINQTTIINNYFVDNHTNVRYNYGPRPEVIQRYTHRPVQVYQVSQLNRPGAPSVGRNTVSLYRPTVNPATVRTARPQNVIQAPRSVGRVVQAAPGLGAERQQPQFRQELPRLQASSPRGEQIQRGGQPGGRGGEQIQRGERGEPGVRGQQMQHGGQPGGRGGEQIQRGAGQGQPGGRGGETIQQPQREQQMRNEQVQRQQQMQREQQQRNDQMQRDQQMRNEQVQRQQQMQRDQQMRNEQVQRQQQMQREQQQRNDQMQRDQQMRNEQAQRQQQMQREQQQRNEQMQRDQQQRNEQMQRQQQMQREQQQRNEQMQRQQQMQREQQQRNEQMQRQQQMQQQQQQRNEQMQRQQQMQQRQEQRQVPQQGQPEQHERGGGRR